MECLNRNITECAIVHMHKRTESGAKVFAPPLFMDFLRISPKEYIFFSKLAQSPPNLGSTPPFLVSLYAPVYMQYAYTYIMYIYIFKIMVTQTHIYVINSSFRYFGRVRIYSNRCN